MGEVVAHRLIGGCDPIADKVEDPSALNQLPRLAGLAFRGSLSPSALSDALKPFLGKPLPLKLPFPSTISPSCPFQQWVDNTDNELLTDACRRLTVRQYATHRFSQLPRHWPPRFIWVGRSEPVRLDRRWPFSAPSFILSSIRYTQKDQ